MFDNFRADVQRYARGRPSPSALGSFRLLLRNFGLQAIAAYRFGRWLSSKRGRPTFWPLVVLLYPVYGLMSAFSRYAYGIHLDQSANIGPGFYVGHFGGIRVFRCTIGPNCSIHQQVELGPAHSQENERGPTLGRDVWIGAHARIRAAVHVGDGATVGAGALLQRDLPDRSLFLGNPGRIAQMNFDNSAIL